MAIFLFRRQLRLAGNNSWAPNCLGFPLFFREQRRELPPTAIVNANRPVGVPGRSRAAPPLNGNLDVNSPESLVAAGQDFPLPQVLDVGYSDGSPATRRNRYPIALDVNVNTACFRFRNTTDTIAQRYYSDGVRQY